MSISQKVINRTSLSIFSLLALIHALSGLWWLTASWFMVSGVLVVALAVIGGMALGTLVSLYLIPLLYWFFYKGERLPDIKNANA